MIVDLFGGSGILSHSAKQVLPKCKVIYNDFDDFHKRLLNVGQTNILIGDIRELIVDIKKESRLSDEVKAKVLDRIKQEEAQGYVDYITLSSSLLFSANYVLNFKDLEKATLYNNVKQSDYLVDAKGYLSGLDIVKQDYNLLFERYKNIPGVVFVVDPPYLSTDTSTYGSDKYWKLGNYLDVLKVLKNTNYVFFTSNKSSLIELCEWFTVNYGLNNPFYKAKLCTYRASINYNSKYTDMMYYKCKEE